MTLPRNVLRAGLKHTVALTVLLLACAGCNSNVSRTLPDELSGHWTTDDVRYEGRSIELSPAFVIMSTGPHDYSVQWIDKVETNPQGDHTEFIIQSTDLTGRTHNETALEFSNSNGGELQFRNQRPVWKRQKDIHQ